MSVCFLCCLVMFLHLLQWCAFQWCHLWCYLFIYLFYFLVYRVLFVIHSDRFARAAWLKIQVPSLCHPLFVSFMRPFLAIPLGGISSPLLLQQHHLEDLLRSWTSGCWCIYAQVGFESRMAPIHLCGKRSCEWLLPLHCFLTVVLIVLVFGFPVFAFTRFTALALV